MMRDGLGKSRKNRSGPGRRCSRLRQCVPCPADFFLGATHCIPMIAARLLGCFLERNLTEDDWLEYLFKTLGRVMTGFGGSNLTS